MNQAFASKSKASEHITYKGGPKWAAAIDDVVVPMPRQIVPVTLIKAQAGIGQSSTLFRDHNSPNDVRLEDTASIDLADGNVFYSVEDCDTAPHGKCIEPPKLAFFVDDHAEIVVLPTQSGESLRELFGLETDSPLVRDDEDREDEVIAPGDSVQFSDGPVFYSRKGPRSTIIVTVHNEDNGVEVRLQAKDDTTIETLIAQMYRHFNIERQNDDRLRCESGGGDVYGDASQTLGDYVKSGRCPCLVWIFAGGTGGAACQ